MFPETLSRVGSHLFGAYKKFNLACALKHFENLNVKKSLVNFVYSNTKYIFGSLASVKPACTRL
jgi:hypothetical protein